MKRYKAIGLAQYPDQPKKRVIKRFKALNDYEARQYIINHFDTSYSWRYSEIE